MNYIKTKGVKLFIDCHNVVVLFTSFLNKRNFECVIMFLVITGKIDAPSIMFQVKYDRPGCF